MTLLEEYDKLFGVWFTSSSPILFSLSKCLKSLQEGSVSPELYSDSDGSGTESGEEFTDDDYSYDEEDEDDDEDAEEGSHADVDDSDHDSGATTHEVGESEDSNKVLSSLSSLSYSQPSSFVKHCLLHDAGTFQSLFPTLLFHSGAAGYLASTAIIETCVC